MILQALSSYYARKASQDVVAADAIAPEGWENKEIPFVIVIDAGGRLINVEDTRVMQGKNLRARRFLLPQGVKRSSGVASNLLWDTPEYALGLSLRGKPERVAEQHAAFCARINAELKESHDLGVEATLGFLASLDSKALLCDVRFKELLDTNAFCTFRLAGDEAESVATRAAVVDALANREHAEANGRCLATGQPDRIALLHPAIKGVWGAQTAGANLVSFNLDAFSSYGKEKGGNAPVGERAVFAYTTAINYLLRRDSPQRLQVGDASTVFWAAESSEFEHLMPEAFAESPTDDPDRGTRAVNAVLKAVSSGVLANSESDTRFHVLGLAPNAARISVRFWLHGKLSELLPRAAAHFDDIQIVRPPFEPQHLPLFGLLRAVAVREKGENIPPRLAGEVMRAALSGPQTPYPFAWLEACVGRVRALRSVRRTHAAIFKACSNRLMRSRGRAGEKEFQMALDTEHPDIPYRLGRLFACYERMQESASKRELNRTLREAYFAGAMSTPRSVFPRLMKLSQTYQRELRRTKPGLNIHLERIAQDIANGFKGPENFPALLMLEEQGRFGLGYYHQRHSFFEPKDKGLETAVPENIQGDK